MAFNAQVLFHPQMKLEELKEGDPPFVVRDTAPQSIPRLGDSGTFCFALQSLPLSILFRNRNRELIPQSAAVVSPTPASLVRRAGLLVLNLQVVHYLLHIWNCRSDLFGLRSFGL